MGGTPGVAVAQAGETVLGLAVRLVPANTVERLPDLSDGPSSRYELLGEVLPLVQLDPAPASAPARVRAAVDWLAPA